jgi:hypothetical protein
VVVIVQFDDVPGNPELIQDGIDTRPENESILSGFKHSMKLSIGKDELLPIAIVIIVERQCLCR